MKTRWFWIVGGITFLIFALVYMPATLLYGWVRPHLSGVQLYGLRGVVVHGHVDGFSTGGRPVAEAVDWQLHPWWLLLGRAGARLEGSGPVAMAATVRSSFDGQRVSLGDVKGQGRVAALAQLVGIPLVPVDGIVDLDLKHVSLLHGLPTAADGTADAHGLVWKFAATPLTLGDFHATAATEKDAIVTQIASVAGPLQADGNVRFDPKNHGYDVDLKVKTKPGAPPELQQLLQALGRPDPGGYFHIRQHGQPHP
jgi:hypothetical protein